MSVYMYVSVYTVCVCVVVVVGRVVYLAIGVKWKVSSTLPRNQDKLCANKRD